jgi:hypothetical protein
MRSHIPTYRSISPIVIQALLTPLSALLVALTITFVKNSRGKRWRKISRNVFRWGVHPLVYQVINLVLYYRVIGVKVPLVYSILNSNT